MDHIYIGILICIIAIILNFYLILLATSQSDSNKFQEQIDIYFKNMSRLGYDPVEIYQYIKEHRNLKDIKTANKRLTKALKSHKL